MKKQVKTISILSSLFLFACSSTPKPCEHAQHDRDTLECLKCGEKIEHHFIDGKCELCDETTEYEWNRIVDREDIVQGSSKKGTVEKFTYQTESFAEIQLNNAKPGDLIEKSAYVYLPNGYTGEKQYNVLILLHGSGDTEGYWFGLDDRYKHYSNDSVFKNCTNENPNGNITVNMLDYMVEHELIKDTIVVTPTYYDDVSEERMKMRIESGAVSSSYGKEMEQYLLPTIAERFSTFATSSDKESLKKARDHFAYAGFSLGSITGFGTIIPDCYDYFGSYGFFSGNAGSLTDVIDTINNSSLSINYAYFGAGSLDTDINNGMKKTYADLSEKSNKINKDNSTIMEIYDTGHFYDSFITQLYNFIPRMFK